MSYTLKKLNKLNFRCITLIFSCVYYNVVKKTKQINTKIEGDHITFNINT